MENDSSDNQNGVKLTKILAIGGTALLGLIILLSVLYCLRKSWQFIMVARRRRRVGVISTAKIATRLEPYDRCHSKAEKMITKGHIVIEMEDDYDTANTTETTGSSGLTSELYTSSDGESHFPARSAYSEESRDEEPAGFEAHHGSQGLHEPDTEVPWTWPGVEPFELPTWEEAVNMNLPTIKLAPNSDEDMERPTTTVSEGTISFPNFSQVGGSMFSSSVSVHDYERPTSAPAIFYFQDCRTGDSEKKDNVINKNQKEILPTSRYWDDTDSDDDYNSNQSEEDRAAEAVILKEGPKRPPTAVAQSDTDEEIPPPPGWRFCD